MHTLILGFDSFDPMIFEHLAAQNRLPNLARYADAGRYSRFEVSDPPQTEVSWTCIATGADPGGHGIFDFVHRDPSTYTPFVSLLPSQRGLAGVQFVPPHRAKTIFSEAAELGYPSTSLWWPATFPARPELPVHTIPGLGAPDLMGRLGIGTLFTTDISPTDPEHKTIVALLQPVGKGIFKGRLEGPLRGKGNSIQASTVEVQLDLKDDGTANLQLGKQLIPLRLGVWSDVLEIPFKMSLLYTLRAVTRVILTHTQPEVRLYFLPLQIHPSATSYRYASPASFARQIWSSDGPYLTLGWPQDTTGLEEGHITDAQFLQLCDTIFSHRERVLMRQLKSFREGLMAIIFDSLDRVQHMFRRDPSDAVEQWYIKLDGLVGRVEQQLPGLSEKKSKLLILSDHGFADFVYKVHLNRWLLEQGYLEAGKSPAKGSLIEVDWPHSQAYAVGLNSLYLNQQGREGFGIVPQDRRQGLLTEMRQKLLEWRGPDGSPVIQRVLLREEAFSGPLVDYGPDLVIGYAPGYRASAETGLGKWKPSQIELNDDHWGGDHCIDSHSVPGVFFSSQRIQTEQPSYRDIPLLAIGKTLDQSQTPPPPVVTGGGEGKEILEERLKSLGYL